MNEVNRLKNSVKIWTEIKNLEELKKGVTNDIAAQVKKINAVLAGDEDIKDSSMKQMRGYYKKIVKLEGQRKEMLSQINKLSAALEDCIFGRGNYDKSQLRIEEVLEAAEKKATDEEEEK